MQNQVFKGQISTMSIKNDSNFKQEIPTRTAYIVVDKDNATLLEKFGMRKYTSENKEDFFVVKTSREIACYKEGIKEPLKLDMTVENGKSIRTAENVTIFMNIIQGENLGNKFYRLQAIKIVNDNDIEEIVAQNPFEDN